MDTTLSSTLHLNIEAVQRRAARFATNRQCSYQSKTDDDAQKNSPALARTYLA